jgi:hypothetical protein
MDMFHVDVDVFCHFFCLLGMYSNRVLMHQYEHTDLVGIRNHLLISLSIFFTKRLI